MATLKPQTATAITATVFRPAGKRFWLHSTRSVLASSVSVSDSACGKYPVAS